MTWSAGPWPSGWPSRASTTCGSTPPASSDFDQRFPTIAASLPAIGLDPAVDWLPIAPAAHHLSGGVVTDLCGATALPGLWAAGEAACTGVHGANRLASNSLLEGMVFGARLAEAIADGGDGPAPTGVMRCAAGRPTDRRGRWPAVAGADGEGIGVRRLAGGLRPCPRRSAQCGDTRRADGGRRSRSGTSCASGCSGP